MKKFLKTSLVLVIIIISGAMLFGCGKKPIQSITLSAPSDTYYVGDEFDISVTLTPDKASRDDLVWEVNNRLIGSVNDGHVKTIGKGRLVVTAYYKKNSNIKDEIVINVIEKTDGLDLKDMTVTYNGQPQTPQYTSPAGVQVLFQYAPMGSSIFTDGLPVNAGSYRVRGYVNGNTSLVDTCNLVIQKKDLKIDVGDATISYSDNFDNIVEVNVEGLVNGESFRFGTKLQNSIPPSQLVVGTYPIVYKVTNSSGEEIELTNYNIIATNGTLTVVPKKVTVIPNGGSKISYGRVPNLTYNVKDENGNDIDSQYLSQITGLLDYVAQDGTSNKNDVGTKNITIGTLSSTNFDIEFDNTKTFTITPQSLRLYPQGKTVLPGTETTDFEYSATGLLAGDRIENPFMLNESKQIIKNDNIVIYDSNNRVVTFNYDISVQEGVEITEGITVNLNINPIEVDYNGTDYETAEITAITDGIIKQNLTVSYINNDGQTVIVNTVNVNDENNYKKISFQISTGTTITVQLGFGTFTKPEKSTTIYAKRAFAIANGGKNYTFNLNDDAGIVIKKIQSVISVEGGDISIEYGDELTNPSLTITKANAGESWKLEAVVKYYEYTDKEEINPIEINKTTPVGSYKIKPVITSADYSMYNVKINEANLSITAAPIDIVLDKDENLTKVYGEADPTFNYTIDGVKNGEEEYDTIVAGQLVREAGENVGEYDINQGSLHTITNNYYIRSYIDGDNKFNITPAPLTITLIDSSKTYGEVDPQLLYTVSGLKFGDTASTVISVSPTREEGEGVKVEGYTISANKKDIVLLNNNYKLLDNNIANATFTINPRPLTINITTKDILSKDDATPDKVVDYSPDGLVNNDQITSITFTFEENNDLQVKEIESCTIENEGNPVTTNYDVQLGTNKIAFNIVETQAIINIDNIIIDYNESGYTLKPTYQLVTDVDGLTVTGITYQYEDIGENPITPVNAGTYYIDAVADTVTLSDPSVSYTVNRGTLIINKINPPTTPVVKTIEYNDWTSGSTLDNELIIEPEGWNIVWNDETESLQQGRHQYLATCTLTDTNKKPNPNYNSVNIWITVIARQLIDINTLKPTLQWNNRVYTGQTYTQNQFTALKIDNKDYLQYLNVSYSYKYNGEDITNGFTNAGTYTTIGTISLKSTYNDLFVITGEDTKEESFSIDKATATLVNTIPANGYKYTDEPIIVWGSENDLYIKENISTNTLTITIYDNNKTKLGIIGQDGYNWPSIYGTYYITIVLESDNYELNINLDNAIEYTINKQTLTITYNNLKDQYTYSNTLSLTKDNIGVTIEGNDGSIDTQTTFYNIIESVPEDIDTSSKKQLDEDGNVCLYQKINDANNTYSYLSIKNLDESLSYYQICDNQTISNAGEYAVVTLASDQNYEGKAYKTFVINKASIGSIRLQSDYITVSRTTTNDELWQTLVNNILTTSIKSQPIYFVITSGSQKYYIRQNNDVVQVTDNNNQAVDNFLNFIKPKTNGNHTITLAIDSSQNYNELRHNFNFNTTKEDVSFEVNFNATNYFNGSYIVPHTVVFSGGYFGEQTKYAIDPAKLTVKGQTLTYVINLEDINEEITITFSSILMGQSTLPRNASSNDYTTTTSVTLENDTYFNLSNTQYSCTYSINRAKYNISASSTKIEVTYTGSQININELKPLVVKNNNNEIIDLTYNTTTNYVNIKVYYQKEGTTNKTEVAPTEVGTYYITFNISVKGGEENNVEIDSDSVPESIPLTIKPYQLQANDILIAGNNIEYDANNGTINTIYSGGVEFKITKNSTSTAPISTDSTFVAKYNDNTQLPSAVGEYNIKISVLNNNNISDLLLKLNINANDISGSGKSVENKTYNYGNIITYNAADLSTNTLLTDDSIDITYYTTENELIKNITDAGSYNIHVKGKGNFTGEFTVNNVIVDKLDISGIELVQQTLTLTNIYGNDLLNNINGAIVENYQVNSENNNVNINGSFIFVMRGNNYVKVSTEDGDLSQGSGTPGGITENLNTEIFKNNIGEELLTCYFIAEDKNFKGTKKDMSFTYVVNPAPTEDKTVDYLTKISINEIISADEIRFNSINSNNKTLLINTDETSITAIFENEFNVYVINNTAYIALTSNYDSVNEVYKVMYDKEYTYSGDVVTGTTGNGYHYTWQEENDKVLFIIEKTLNTTDKTIELLGGKYRISENYEYGDINVDIQFTPTAIDGSLIIDPLSEGGSYQLGGKELSVVNSNYINIRPEYFVAMNNADLLDPTVTFTYNSETYTLNTGNNLNSVLDKNGNKNPLPAGTYNATLTIVLPNTIWYETSQSVQFTLETTVEKIDLRWNPQSLQEITAISDVPTFIYEEAIGSTYYVTYYQETQVGSKEMFTITYNDGIADAISINIGDLSTLPGGLYSYSITDSKGIDKLNSEYNNNTGYFVLYKADMFEASNVVYGKTLSITDIMQTNSLLELFAYENENINLNDVIDVNFFNNNYLDVDVKDNVITAFYLPIEIITTYRAYSLNGSETTYKDYSFSGSATIKVNLSQGYKIVPIMDTISKVYDGKVLTVKANVYSRNAIMIEGSEEEGNDIQEKLELIEEEILTENTSGTDAGEYKVEFTYLNYTQSIYAQIIKATPKFTINNDSLIQVYNGLAHNVSVNVYGINDNTLTSIQIKYKKKDASDDPYSTTAPINAGEYDVKIVHNSQNYYGEYYTVLTVNKAMATVTVGDTTFEYSGSNQTPIITVKGLNNLTLTPESNYQVVYNDGAESINAGSYTAVLNMLDGSNYTYQENYTISYAIKPKQVSDLTLDTTEYTYNGNEQIPTVMDGGVKVIEDDNITIQKPSNSINAGSYSITITGQNNYVGKAVLNYVIRPSELDITVDSTQTFVYNGSIQRPTYIVQDHNDINVSNTYYEVVQSDSIDVGSYKITISSNSDNYVGEYIIEYVIKPYQVQIEVSGLNKVYGEDGEPSIIVKGVDGEELTSGYSITYDGEETVPTDAGEYLVEVVMTNNNYVGTFVGNYTIQKDKANISITNLEQDYTGIAINPTIQVTNSKHIELVESDYTVTYKDNGEEIDKNSIINAGEYTVEVELSNPNYYGYSIATFVINKLIANIDITTTNFVYDGTVHGLEYQVIYNGEQVTEQSNTVATIKNIKTNQVTELQNAGVYEIYVLVLTNNYQAQATKYIEIYKKEATIEVTNLEVEYNGTPQKPNISIKDNGSLLGGISYNTTYNGESVSPTAAGVYDIVITINNDNYYGTYSGKFVISKATPTITWNTGTEFTYGSVNVSEATIDANGTSVTYYFDGQVKTIEEIKNLPAGTYVITAQFDGNENYNAVSISKTIVIKKLDISDQITIKNLTQQYDGTDKEPTISVQNNLGYEVTYNGVSTLPNEVGTYEVIVRVNTDNYIGLKVAVFEIISQDSELIWDTNTVFEYGSVNITELAGARYTINNNDAGDLSSIANAGDYTVVAIVGDKSVTKTITVIPQKKDITISYNTETNDFSAVFDGTDITVELKYYNGETELTQEQIKNKEWGDVLTIIAEVEYGTGNYYGYAQSTFTTETAIIEEVVLDNLSGVSSIIEDDYISTGNTINFDSNYSVTVVEGNSGIEILDDTINITKAGRYLVKYSLDSNNNAYKYQYIVINKIDPNFEWNVSQYEYDKGDSVSLNGATADGGTISYQVDDSNTFDNIDDLNAYINGNPADSYKITAILDGGDNYYSKTISYYITFKSIKASVNITNNTFEVGEEINLGLIVTPTGATYTPTYYNSNGEEITLLDNLQAGKYYAIVEFTGNYVGSYRFDFVVNKKITSINWNSRQFVYDGQDHRQEIKNASVDGVTDDQIEYTIDNENAWINVGSYTATAKFAGNNEYEACEVTLTFAIIPAKVEYVIDSQTSIFDNQSTTPTIQVIGINNDPLSKDTDYTVGYYKGDAESEIKDAGEYEIRVTIINSNYCGSQSFSYIVQKAQATITIADLNTDYNGQSQSPTINVTGIDNDIDNYSVTYNELTTNELTTEPSDAGSYKVKVIVDDTNYYGEQQATFVINKIQASIEIAADELEKMYNGTQQQPQINVVGLNKIELQNSEYSIVYKKNNEVVQDLTNAGTYQIYVEVDDSINYYGSAQFEYTIHKAKANITVSNYVRTYNGNNQKPIINVTGINDTTLSIDTDYEVVYKNGEAEVTSMIYAGTYSVVVNITNPNYYGEESFDFIIQQAQAHFSVTNLLQTYNGTNLQPNIRVTGINGTSLQSGDYSVTYNNETTLPQNVDEYAVEITINNSNYYGYYKDTFVIQKAKVSIIVNGNDTFEYDGNAHKLEFSMTGGTLSASDYTVKYYNTLGNEINDIDNIVNVGVYKAVVEIINNNYSGEYIHYMNITPKDIADITLSIAGSELSNNTSLALTYDGSSYEFDYKNISNQKISYVYQYAKLGSATYTPASEMTIQQAGRYNIILTGTGNYKGQIRFFIVVNKQNNPYTISNTTYVYDGEDHISTIKDSITPSSSDIKVYNYYDLNNEVSEVINAGTYLVRVSDNNSVPYEFVVSVLKVNIFGLKQTDSSELPDNEGTLSIDDGLNDKYDSVISSSGNIFQYTFNAYKEGSPHQINLTISVIKYGQNYTYRVLYVYNDKIMTYDYVGATTEQDISISITSDGEIVKGQSSEAYLNCPLTFSYKEGSSSSTSVNKMFTSYVILDNSDGVFEFDINEILTITEEEIKFKIDEEYVIKTTFVLRYIKTISETEYITSTYTLDSVTSNVYKYSYYGNSGEETTDEETGTTNTITEQKLLNSTIITVTYGTNKITIEGDNFIIEL